MKSFNQCVFVGHAGRAPEERTVNEKQVCNFTLAIDESKDKDPLWLTVVAWRKLAEQVTASVKKGDLLLVTGKLSIRKYTDKQQLERTAVEVIASDIRFLSPKKDLSADRQDLATVEEMAPPHQSVASI